MSKYDGLGIHLRQQFGNEIPMTFSEIARVTGGELPAKARLHRAWWSNNPSNNVMTKVWLDAGFRTEQVDIAGEKLMFRRAQPRGLQENSRMFAPASAANSAIHPLVGALKGTFTVIAPEEPSMDATELDEMDANIDATARLIAEGMKG